MTGKEVFRSEDLHMYFGGVHAVEGVSFSIDQGSFFGIIGPNGSGKSTLFNAVTGIYTPTRGKVIFEGEDITGLKQHEIVHKGIKRTFQNMRTFHAMSVLDNVIVGQHIEQHVTLKDALFKTRTYREEEKRCKEKALEVIDMVGLYHKKDEISMNMSYGQQKRLELARALVSHSRLLLLDEPTSGIPKADGEALMDLIMGIKEQTGLTILIIEHNMNIVTKYVDRIIAMDRGCKIAEGTPQEVMNDPLVIEAYLGDE